MAATACGRWDRGAAGPRGYVLQEPRRLFMKKRNRKPQWRWVRGPGVKWGVGLKRLLELEASPERWGAECRAFATRAPTQRVLVAVPFRESMPDSITERLASLLGELETRSRAQQKRAVPLSELQTHWARSVRVVGTLWTCEIFVRAMQVLQSNL